MRLTSLRMLAAAAALTIGAAGAATALELRAGSASPPTYVGYDPVYTVFMDRLAKESGGELTAKHFGLEVANLNGMLAALQSGVIDVGNFQPGYLPAEFPNILLVGELAALGGDSWAMCAAMNEYFVGCDDCRAEFSKRDIVLLVGASTTTYNVLTVNKPVKTVEDLKGLRLRTPGSAFSRWILAMGGIPGEISFNEEYEALQSGLLDGSIAPADNLIGNRLIEVVKYYTPVAVGTFHATGNFTASKETWKKLTVDQRKALVRSALSGATNFEVTQRNSGAKAVEQLVAKGGQVVEPSAELLEASRKTGEGAIATAIELGTSKYNVADPEGKVKRFAALVEKWRKLAEPIKDDPEAIAQKMWDEIWTKVDFETYGM